MGGAVISNLGKDVGFEVDGLRRGGGYLWLDGYMQPTKSMEDGEWKQGGCMEVGFMDRWSQGPEMTPKALVEHWVQLFNRGDIDGLVSLYAPDAINHQVVTRPLRGRDEIRRMFDVEFGRATMVCLIENVFEDGEWAILEWRDPKGLRGCGFFRIRDDRIIFQRGYFDQLSFFRQQGIEVPDDYLNPSE